MHRYLPMLLVLSANWLAGCAAPQQRHDERAVILPDCFLFDAQPESDVWRPRFLNFHQIAQAYTKTNNIDFSFEGTSSMLWVFQEDGAVVARIEFSSRRIGSPFFAMYVDTQGKVLRHHIGFVHAGEP